VTEEARESDWRGEDLNRLALVVEEAFVYMMTNTPEGVSELELRIRAAVNHAEIELRCGETTSNVETQLRNIDTSEKPEDLGLKVLKYMTDDLKHQQFSNGEFLILRLNHRATPTARLS
jgi:anti-sigma regulatory factor (Ser/Thr protein kinase)